MFSVWKITFKPHIPYFCSFLVSRDLRYQKLLISQQKLLHFFHQSIHIIGQLILNVMIGWTTSSKSKLFFKNYFIFSKVSINPIIHHPIIHHPIMRSTIFEKHERNDIGRKLVKRSFSPFFKIGDTFPIFSLSGNILVFTHESVFNSS